MNKNSIQKYAIWARNELINQITQRAFQYGITPKERPEKGLASINGIMLTPIEQKQRDQLVEEVWRKGFDQVIEELAYTWFNRLIAIRFMEVNDYLPEGVRVLSNSKNEFKPEILTSALNLDEDHFKKDLILKLIDEGKQEELYRYLLLAECNALNEILPVMFEKMDGYTELMLPANLLKSDSVIGKLISDIDEADWKVTDPEDEEGGQVQIIGWLYQYYISEKHNQVVDVKGNIPISKIDIPAATQLFTPDWVVRYMVENTLGKRWCDSNPDSQIKNSWKYIINEERRSFSEPTCNKLNVEEIYFVDLAMGSGHILVTAFDLLMQIYRSEGYRDRDAVKNILIKNLYGLDIDDRAAQLAYFAVMMKAREYDRRIFSRGIQPNLFSIPESNDISNETIEFFSDGDQELEINLRRLVEEMVDAKEFGSLLEITPINYEILEKRISKLENDYNPYAVEAIQKIQPLINVGKILGRSNATVCCMNPPYLNRYEDSLKVFMYKNYKGYTGDLYSAFIKRSMDICSSDGYIGMVTPNTWLSAKLYKELRSNILKTKSLTSLLKLAKGSFYKEATVDLCSFTIKNNPSSSYGVYFNLDKYKANMEDQKLGFIRSNKENNDTKFCISLKNCVAIPNEPIAFWLPQVAIDQYKKGLTTEILITKQGLKTGDNDRFLRFWFEVPFNTIFTGNDKTTKKWFPCNKGGDYRKWYGNIERVLDWSNNGEEIRNFKNDKGKLMSRPQNLQYNFCEGLTWSTLSSGPISFRYSSPNMMFESKGSLCLPKEGTDLYTIQAFLNSKVCMYYLKALSDTIDYTEGNILNLPFAVKYDETLSKLAKQNTQICKLDWDSRELSIEFQRNPLLPNHANSNSLEEIWKDYKAKTQNWFDTVKTNEESINQKLIESFCLQKVLDSSVEDRSISILQADSSRNIKELISYAIGELFGRYSQFQNGIIDNVFINNLENCEHCFVDPDNIIPIGDDEYFEDDLTIRFVDWVKTTYGEKNIEENLQFIANALGGKGSSREVIRKYFLNDFFTDHCKTYKKRPIYWLFDSGKKNGFKCLIYIHRYQPDTIARIRTDYVHEQQERYRSQIKHIEDTIDDAPKSEQVKLRKQLKDLTGKLDEVTKYEEKIHHLADQMIKIDLDDGVKHNYALFQDVLAKIK